MHLLKPDEARRARPMGRPYACVTVKVMRLRPRILQVQPGPIGIVKFDAQMSLLPPDVKVIGPEEETIPASGQFLISVETFDPYHLLVDWNGDDWR